MEDVVALVVEGAFEDDVVAVLQVVGDEETGLRVHHVELGDCVGVVDADGVVEHGVGADDGGLAIEGAGDFARELGLAGERRPVDDDEVRHGASRLAVGLA